MISGKLTRTLLMLVLSAPLLGIPGWAARPKPHKKAAVVPVVHDGDGPAYHAGPPRGPLPQTLSPDQFSDPRVKNAFAMAARIRPVLYQQPCYCHCDRAFGHKSLLSCYTGTHASVCEVCLMEGIFAYQETQKGKSPTQIRKEIEAGQWKKVNLNDYSTLRTY